jgi:hypothetical protein
MKTIKRNIFIKSLLLIMAVAFLGSCKKDDGGSSSESGKGTFIVNGTTYSGVCQSIPATSGVAGNLDAVIASTTGASFTVYNIPTGSSGTSNVVEFTDSNGFSSELYVLCITNANGTGIYSSTGGTITKTGSNSYKFSVEMIDLTTNQHVTVTGSGKY